MNFEQLLERHLEAADQMIPDLPGDVDVVMSRGRRRRLAIWAGQGLVVAAAVVAVVFGANSLLRGPAVDPTVPVGSTPDGTTPPVTTIPSSVPATSLPSPVGGLGLVDVVALFGGEGVTLYAGGTAHPVAGDRYYEGVGNLVGDGAGGLVFVHEVTPLPWHQGTILRLASGAVRPEVLLAGDAGALPGNRRLAGPVGPGGIAFADLVVGEDAQQLTVSILDLSTGTVADLATLSWPFDNGVFFSGIAAAGNTVAVAESGDACPRVLTWVDGEPSRTIDLACAVSVDDLSISPDGSRVLVSYFDSDAGDWGISVIDISTGEVLADHPVQGWSISWKSPFEAVFVAAGGVTVLDLATGTTTSLGIEPGNGLVTWLPAVDIAATATTGSGSGLLPCTPGEPGPADTAWMASAPTAVVDTWTRLRTLAAACDYEGLEALAVADRPALAFDEIDHDDLAGQWVRGAAYGYDVRAEVLAYTALAPAAGPDGSWIWPAVTITGSDADWQTLRDAGVLGSDEFEAMRSFGQYLGFRVSIEADGRWSSALAGD